MARPLFGWVSDTIGRENTMVIAFTLGGVSYWLLGSAGGSPWSFVVFAGLIFLTWGEIFSLFPSTCTDTFGPRYATANLSFLYTAKGASALLVPLANVIKTATGGWHMVFVVTALMNFAVVRLALFVLKPMRARQVARRPSASPPAPSGTRRFNRPPRAARSLAPRRRRQRQRFSTRCHDRNAIGAVTAVEIRKTCHQVARAAAGIDDALLDRPAIDVEPVGQIAEPCRRHRRQAAVERERRSSDSCRTAGTPARKPAPGC